jgi:hypothetical protein
VSRFVDSSGNVEWQAYARTLVGGVFGAIFAGWASVVLGIADFVLAPVEWLSGYLGRLVEVTAGAPARVVESAWRGALGFVLEGGPLAFVLAIAVVLTTLYVAVRIGRLA